MSTENLSSLQRRTTDIVDSDNPDIMRSLILHEIRDLHTEFQSLGRQIEDLKLAQELMAPKVAELVSYLERGKGAFWILPIVVMLGIAVFQIGLWLKSNLK